MRNKILTKSLILLMGLFLFASISPAQKIIKAKFKVTKVYATVSPKTYKGKCPFKFNFTGYITTNGKGIVKYKWIRKDSAIAPVKTIYFIKAETKKVTTSWYLGGAGKVYKNYWEAVQILSPNSITSNKAYFSLYCKGASKTPVVSLTGSNQPGPTPTVKYLPDLKPVSLFFDKDCNLMVKIKNVGKGKFVGPRTGFRFFMDGGLIGSSSYNLILFPNSTVTKMVCQKALLGVWVEKTKSWRYVVNEKGPIQGSSAIYVEESNDTNNSITKKLVCQKFKILRKRLPETKPPTPTKKN